MLAFKALLFDLDGTLLDTAPDFISALNIQLVMHGREPLPASAVRTSVILHSQLFLSYEHKYG